MRAELFREDLINPLTVQNAAPPFPPLPGSLARMARAPSSGHSLQLSLAQGLLMEQLYSTSSLVMGHTQKNRF